MSTNRLATVSRSTSSKPSDGALPPWMQNSGVSHVPLDFKDQYFGCEIEMTGLTRQRAAQVLAEHFQTSFSHHGGYDAYHVMDPDGKEWKIVYDGSIDPEVRSHRALDIVEEYYYKVELNSPKLEYSEMFEGDTDTVNAYNKTLTADGDYAN